jgi:hypothetical protein
MLEVHKNICFGDSMANPKWPEQPIFIERVKHFCKKSGLLTPRGAVRLDETAKVFQLSPVTLQQFIYHKGRGRPHLDTLSRIAGIVGCSLADLAGGPGGPPFGADHEGWARVPANDRLFASTVAEDVLADELTGEEKAELFEAYKEARDRMLRLRKAAPAMPAKAARKG